MKRSWIFAAMLSLMVGCGAAAPKKQAVAAAETIKRLADEALDVYGRVRGETFALGSTLTREGAITADSSGDSFRRGVEIYLSIDVASASSDQTIDVQWIDPRGRVARRETRNVAEGGHHAAFSSGRTTEWATGNYRAVVVINTRKVNEIRFAIL